MDAQTKKELQALEREIAVLEWDKRRNQLNPGKEVYLKKIVERRDTLIAGKEVELVAQ